jgi:hypothetical protein
VAGELAAFGEHVRRRNREIHREFRGDVTIR